MNLNNYVDMLSNIYLGGTNNHPEHNSNPHYWALLLRQLIVNPTKFTNKNFLDFGCGKGRNVTNAHSLVEWQTADGVDISPNNINFCKAAYNHLKSNFYLNSGSDLSTLESNKYDFVMSTIVLQHICVHELRFNLLKEIYRVMRTGGIFSFQMGFGDLGFVKDAQISKYHDNNYYALNSNGTFDVRVEKPNDLLDDLTKIGFKNSQYNVKNSWADGGHLFWIYVETNK